MEKRTRVRKTHYPHLVAVRLTDEQFYKTDKNRSKIIRELIDGYEI